jgi:hypothetical protein
LVRWFAGAAVLATVEAGVLAVLAAPAAAQGFPFFPFFRREAPPGYERRPRQPPPSFNPFGFFRRLYPDYHERDFPRGRPDNWERRPAVDFSRAPPPRKHEGIPTTTVVVIGDSMADWLGYGLEEAFADSPEFGIVRKLRAGVGLLRHETRSGAEGFDWVAAARDIVAGEKADFIVVMMGLADRQGIREQVASTETNRQPERPRGRQSGDRAQPTVVTHEFRSERWAELYSKRIDDLIAAARSRGASVLWVGLPAIRGPRARSDLAYLNDLYRARAEKAGITYIDVWDGFVDEDGNFTLRGPDYSGQIRQLRTSDGVHFTRAGATKLAHYVEREIRRLLAARTSPVALPEPEADPGRAGAGARAIAGPVLPLTATPTTTGTGELAGGPRATLAAADPTVTTVLVKGEPVPSKSGRADDFTWSPPDPLAETAVIPPPEAPPAAPSVVRPLGAAAPPPVQLKTKRSARPGPVPSAPQTR